MIPHPPQFIPQKVCLSCDVCCRFKENDDFWTPKFGEHERQSELAMKIFKPEMFDKNHHMKTIKTATGCHCQFFNTSDQTCSVYAARPFECEFYPFLLAKQNGRASVYIHLHCPYIQQTIETASFETFAAKIKEFIHKEDTLNFIRKNPALLRDYSQHADEVQLLFFIDS